MLGTTSDYYPHDDDANRPTKRARNGPAGNNYYHDSATLGTTEEPTTSTDKPKGGPTLAAQRVQEKDKNRRLSCKECRR
jgi:hypothetical protein